MHEYVNGTISHWLNITPIPYSSGAVFWWTNNFLSFFYQFPWKFVDWLNLIFGIKEWWISILATIFVVSMILIVLFRFTSTNHN